MKTDERSFACRRTCDVTECAPALFWIATQDKPGPLHFELRWLVMIAMRVFAGDDPSNTERTDFGSNFSI